MIEAGVSADGAAASRSSRAAARAARPGIRRCPCRIDSCPERILERLRVPQSSDPVTGTLTAALMGKEAKGLTGTGRSGRGSRIEARAPHERPVDLGVGHELPDVPRRDAPAVEDPDPGSDLRGDAVRERGRITHDLSRVRGLGVAPVPIAQIGS